MCAAYDKAFTRVSYSFNMRPRTRPLTYKWKKNNINDYSFVLRGSAFKFWQTCSLWGPRHLPPVGGCPKVITLSVRLCPSVCPSANFNIMCNIFNIADRVFIFGMRTPDGKVITLVTWIFNMLPWPWPLIYNNVPKLFVIMSALRQNYIGLLCITST